MATKIITDNIDLSSDTTALEIPTGTTLQRPGTMDVDFLVVAGAGGGGGSYRAGGGGAGGLRTSYGSTSGGGSSVEDPVKVGIGLSYAVTVGTGGAGGVYGATTFGTNGNNSIFATIESQGGGGGGYYTGGTGTAGITGGSGGGGGGDTTGGAAGAGTTNQGYAGGAGASSGTQCGGGGGGAGVAGNTGGSGPTDGDGGDGINSLILPYTEAGTAGVGEQISGTEVWYAGGGAGGAYSSGNTTIPGKGGGGDGTPTTGYPGNGGPGTDNTGGGGGGASGEVPPTSGVGGDGGDGVVILRYPSSATLNKTGTLVESTGSPFTITASETNDTKVSVFISGNGTIDFSDATNTVAEGTMRENTTTGKMEIYTGTTGWRALQQTGQDTGVVAANNFASVSYNGNGNIGYASNVAQTITAGNGFQSDLTIIKNIAGTYSTDVWNWFDSTRDDNVSGGSIYCALTTSSTTAEMCPTYAGGYYQLIDFISPGFTLGEDASARVNASGDTYVSYSWKGGGDSNTFNKDGTGYATASAAGLTAGTITPTHSSVNTETGFSIIRYTGTGSAGTLPHGLGVTPEFIVIKAVDAATNWIIYNKTIGVDGYIYFNDTGAANSYSTAWDNITTTTFGLPAAFSDYNTGSTKYVAYCWASVPGYSLIGSYIGTGTRNGINIYTGFTPSLISIKCISNSGTNWPVFDSARNTSNPRNTAIWFNSMSPGSNYVYGVDFNDAGFQVVDPDGDLNAAGREYIFMVFA